MIYRTCLRCIGHVLAICIVSYHISFKNFKFNEQTKYLTLFSDKEKLRKVGDSKKSSDYEVHNNLAGGSLIQERL